MYYIYLDYLLIYQYNILILILHIVALKLTYILKYMIINTHAYNILTSN